MNKRTTPDTTLREAEQRLVGKIDPFRRDDIKTDKADVDRYFGEPEALKSVHPENTFPHAIPFATIPPAKKTILPVIKDDRSYLARRIAMITQPGISLAARLRAVPILGYAMSVAKNFFRAPLIRQHNDLRLQALEESIEKYAVSLCDQLDQLEELNRLVNRRIDAIEPSLDQIASMSDSNFSLLDQRLQKQEVINAEARLHPIESLGIGPRLMNLEKIEAERKIKQFTSLLQHAEKESVFLRSQLQKLEQRIQSMTEGSQRSFLSSPEEVVKASHALKVDDFFKDFEDAFRGSKEDIKQRLRVYLPYLESAGVSKQGQVIDVGCGRGEWLELLAENQIPALGVDLNLAKVEECIAQGLAAKAVDAIVFLRAQEEGSVAAVTGFHIIEHLPFEIMLALFDAAFFALRPGGILIFETPNPENLLVGSCNFYFDPTHLHPIVPGVAQFIAQQRGFSNAEILRLHPYPDDHLTTGTTDVDKVVNRYFFGPQDYAVIARK